MINHKCQYVYVYLDPRKTGKWTTSVMSFLYEPIYIGEGKNNRSRHHLIRKDRHPLVNKIAKIRKSQLEPHIVIVADQLTGDEGLALETQLIYELGTKAIIDKVKRGPLCNLQIEEGSKRVISEETKKKLSASVSKSLMGHPVSKETRQKISEAYHKSPVSKINRAEAHTRTHLGKKMSAEAKDAIGNYFRGVPKSEEHRQKISSANKGKKFSETHKAAIAKSRVSYWKITNNNSSVTTNNLKDWCLKNQINESSLKSAYRYKSEYRGFRIEKLCL